MDTGTAAERHDGQWPGGNRSIPRVVIIGVPGRDRVREEAIRLRPTIAQHAEIITEDYAFSYEFGDPDIDLVIVFGGDGSILQTARQLQGREIPVLGINCGRLGFLAALAPDDFLEVWPKVCCGAFEMVDHLMLEVQLIRNGDVVGR
ncbi:MAG: NAD(+)/NADH kinase, partial [Planctomycetota bacterium]